jgi:hypothetical protein
VTMEKLSPAGGEPARALCGVSSDAPIDTRVSTQKQAPSVAWDNFFLKHADALALTVWCDDRAELWEKPVKEAGADSFTITLFPDQYASSMRFASTTLRELGDRIQRTTARSKANLPFVKFAHFGNERTPADCLRHDKNIVSVNGCELDYDGKKISFETAVATAEKAGLHCLIYTSASYTDDEPKWRIICPASKAVEGPESYLRDTRAKWVARVNGVFGGIFAPESFVLSQAYYFGGVKGKPAPRVVVVEGDFIDERLDLDAGALGKDRKPATDTEQNPWLRYAAEILQDRATYSDLIEPILSGDGYNQQLIRLVSKLAAAGTDENSIVDLAQGVMELSKAPRDARWQNRYDDIPRYVESAVRKYAPEAPVPEVSPPEPVGLGEWDAGDDVELPPPRAWLLGNIFCRKFMSSLIADGGVGKTALRYAQLVSLATGRSLTGDFVFERCRVLIVSLEDDRDELRRRIRAVCLRYNIALSDLKGWLYLSSPGAGAGKLMTLDKRGGAYPWCLGR